MGREGEREREKHQCVVASHVLPTGDLAHNPGMCPDWESNQLPCGSQSGTQSTEPHQPGPEFILVLIFINYGILFHKTNNYKPTLAPPSIGLM